MIEKIEIETGKGTSTNDKKAALFSGGKEKAKTENNKTAKAEVTLIELIKGITIAGDNTKQTAADSERIVIKNGVNAADRADKDKYVMPFGDKIKTLISKIKS